jgi:hypothetical protein
VLNSRLFSKAIGTIAITTAAPINFDPRLERDAEARGKAEGVEIGKRLGITKGYLLAKREALAALTALMP